MLQQIVLQVAQVLTVLLLAPLLHGFIVKMEEKVQRGQGPSIFQPYRDLWKLFHKTQLVPETASWVFFAAPVLAFVAMMIVPMLIPVLTNFPLPLSDMGDILGGGLILTLGSFFILLAGLDTGQPFGGLGSSRAVMLGILAEPTLILVFVGITFLDHSMLPFVANHLLAQNSVAYWSPAHIFLIFAFLILLTVETDRLPIHSTIPYEIYMIDEARILEYSGPLLALLKWASWMKQFILYTIFLNVFLFPWGLSVHGNFGSVVLALLIILGKYGLLGLFMVVVDTMQSRLRFYRYQEPLALSFLFAVLAIVADQL
ncbi:MAG: NADH-quinone oxidoreductase subunit H [Candidatus Igneacidithiobacillus chanchocoensis]